jgi:two-component system, OmpR family, response regulator
MMNKGTVLSRTMIMEHVWNADSDPFSNTVEAHILNLRKKIQNGENTATIIKNVTGRGYKIEENEE